MHTHRWVLARQVRVDLINEHFAGLTDDGIGARAVTDDIRSAEALEALRQRGSRAVILSLMISSRAPTGRRRGLYTRRGRLSP